MGQSLTHKIIAAHVVEGDGVAPGERALGREAGVGEDSAFTTASAAWLAAGYRLRAAATARLTTQ